MTSLKSKNGSRPAAGPQPDHRLLFELAAEQGGYFTSQQAHEAGFSTGLVKHHVHRGKFLPVRRRVGIYRLRDFPTSPHEELWAAWVRVGPEAVISHASALRLQNLSDVVPDAVHIWVPYAKRPRMRRSVPPGVRIHVTRVWLDPHDVTMVDGLQVTTPLRTLLDVAVGRTSPEQVVLAIKQALDRGLITAEELRRAAVQRGPKLATRVDRFLREAAA